MEQNVKTKVISTQKDGYTVSEVIFNDTFQDKVTIISHNNRIPFIFEDTNKTKLTLKPDNISDLLLYKSDTIPLDKLFFDDYSPEFIVHETNYYSFDKKRYLMVFFKDMLSSSFMSVYRVILEVEEGKDAYHIYSFTGYDGGETINFQYIDGGLNCEIIQLFMKTTTTIRLKDGIKTTL